MSELIPPREYLEIMKNRTCFLKTKCLPILRGQNIHCAFQKQVGKIGVMGVQVMLISVVNFTPH